MAQTTLTAVNVEEFNNFNSLDGVELRVFIPAVVARKHAYRSVHVVAAWSWLVGFSCAHFLLFFRETTNRFDVH